jgi:hypothetical protein
VEVAVRRPLPWVVGVHLHDGSGRVFQGECALSEPVNADAIVGHYEIFEGVHVKSPVHSVKGMAMKVYI